MDDIHSRLVSVVTEHIFLGAMTLVFGFAFFILTATKGRSNPWFIRKTEEWLGPSVNRKLKDEEDDDPFSLKSIVPFSGLPLHEPPNWPRYWKSGKYQLTMGLRRLDINNWMTFDDQWFVEHEAKKRYCKLSNKTDVVDYLDGEDEAVTDLLDLVVAYLTRKFPDMFALQGEYITIRPVNEKYRIKQPFDQPPMEIIGLLVMDDLYILKHGLRDLYYLRGAFLACPTAWRLSERIGWPLHQIHGPVPMWKEKLQKSMEKFFVNLKVSSPIQRNNLFIQPVDGLFHFEPFDEHSVVQKPEDIYLRTGLQSLRRLPKSKAIVFSVRTYLTPLTDLKNEPEALERLWDAVRHFPDAVSKHKVRHLWNDVFEAFCKDTLGREDPEIDPDTGDGIGTKSMGEAKTCPAGFA